MKLTKGMKIFWIFIAVGLVFSMIMVVAGDNPFLFSNYQLEKEFDEEYIGEMADVIMPVAVIIPVAKVSAVCVIGMNIVRVWMNFA